MVVVVVEFARSNCEAATFAFVVTGNTDTGVGVVVTVVLVVDVVVVVALVVEVVIVHLPHSAGHIVITS